MRLGVAGPFSSNVSSALRPNVTFAIFVGSGAGLTPFLSQIQNVHAYNATNPSKPKRFGSIFYSSSAELAAYIDYANAANLEARDPFNL